MELTNFPKEIIFLIFEYLTDEMDRKNFFFALRYTRCDNYLIYRTYRERLGSVSHLLYTSSLMQTRSTFKSRGVTTRP